MMTSRRPALIAVPFAFAGAALAVALAGCGSSSTSTASPTTAAASPASAGTPVTHAATTLTATLTEFHIALSQASLAPGSYTVVATNAGQTTHALTIVGGGTNVSSGQIQPGQSKTMTVTLATGAYQVYCPIDGHRQLGMNTSLTVGGAPSAPTTTAGSSSGGGY